MLHIPTDYTSETRRMIHGWIRPTQHREKEKEHQHAQRHALPHHFTYAYNVQRII
ncbi:unnamed protein product [Ectocarpus sp. 8 AP-2014]